jgi:hypothetical protein
MPRDRVAPDKPASPARLPLAHFAGVTQEVTMEKNRRLPSAEEVRRHQDNISVLGVRGDFDLLTNHPFLKEAKQAKDPLKSSHPEGEKLNSAAEKQIEKPINDQFVFKKAGPGWIIVFEGKALGPFKNKGFAYMHHCVENSHKSFSALELYKAVNGEEERNTLKSLPIEAGEDEAGDDIKEKNDFRGFQFTSGVPNKAGDFKADEKTLSSIQNRQKEIRDELDEAERNNDVGKMGKLKFEREQIMKYLEKIQWKKGGKIIRKIFSNDETKVRDRIFHAISRALEELRKHNELAYEHFSHAFKPISNFPKKYKPAKKIPWILS